MKTFVLQTITFLFFLCVFGFANDGSKDKKNNLNKTLDQTPKTYLDINNISTPMTAPAPLIVKAIARDKEIILDWGENVNNYSAIENYTKSGYSFQGYNVYQFPSATALNDQAKRIATFDIIDGVLKILDWDFNPIDGAMEYLVIQFGNDTGIKRFLDITTDQINGSPLVNGNNYYFAVTSYSYNPDLNASPNNLESLVQILTVSPKTLGSDSIHNASFSSVIHTGSADGNLTLKIIDPTKTSENPYQVYFTQRTEVRNVNGDWVPKDSSVISGGAPRIAKYWNLKDSVTNQIKLENQSVVNGIDLFPKRSDIATNPGVDAAPIVDGFQINVNIGYDSPINYLQSILSCGPGSNSVLTHNAAAAATSIDLLNYTIFGTTTSTAKDNFGFGTSDINILQKDYYLKFNGVWDSSSQIAGHSGQLIHFIKPGTGSWATIFSATDLSTHPLNPNPGVNKPFLVRIPFEVWSKDDNRQVNIMFRDRAQNETDNPFWAWNPGNRMYALLVNTNYDSVNAIPAVPDSLNANATWVLVFYGTNYSLGDLLEVDYANPVQIGSDKFTFTASGVTGVKDQTPLPVNFNLSQNYPNPFNPSTIISYSIPHAGLVSLKIYDVLGREVRSLLNEYKTNGTYTVNFNARGLSSGIYFYRLTMDNYTDVKKLVLLK